MGVRLILLLGLLAGVLYCVHLLAQDYQTIFGATKLLRFLVKRDLSWNVTKPNVRWKKIIQSDPIQCARYLYCELGTHTPDNDLKKGLIYMLTLEPRTEDERAWTDFWKAYRHGIIYRDNNSCKKQYALCPFHSSFLFEIIRLLLPMRMK